MTGLVLTAGGARGAYQAGVLKRIGEIAAFQDRPSPFRIIAGASAGAINGSMVAGHSSNFREGTALLATMWSQLTAADVFRTDTLSMAHNAGRLFADMALGKFIGSGRVQSLVDTSPLREFLRKRLPLTGIAKAIHREHLYALAVTATGYHSGRAFTFIQGKPGHPLWTKSRRVALPATLTVDHICASAAIPIVFPPVPLQVAGARAYFGDGALRLVTPLSPAIRLGADRLFAIGVRCQESANDLLSSELSSGADSDASTARMRRPPMSQICGVFLNAIFLDHLDADVDHLLRMNDLVSTDHVVARDKPDTGGTPREPMRVVTPMIVSPSEDIAVIAKTLAHRMPRTIRYVLDGLGTPDVQSADLTSYLLFDSMFTSELIQMGYRDADRRIDEIEAFLFDDAAGTADYSGSTRVASIPAA
jgi:NTE family protein